MSTSFAGHSGISRVLEMVDPENGTRKLAIEFETGSGPGVVIVTADEAGRLSLRSVFRESAPARPPAPEEKGLVVCVPVPAPPGGDAESPTPHRPDPQEIEELHARRDAILRRSMRLLALPVHGWSPPTRSEPAPSERDSLLDDLPGIPEGPQDPA